jgi:hypothetical protein
MILDPVIDGPHADVDPLQTAKRALHLRQALVLPDRIRRREPIGGFIGTNHIDPIQLHFLLNGRRIPRPLEAAVGNRDSDVLGHLVVIDHATHFDAEGRVVERRLGAPGGLRGELRERAFGRDEQLLPFPAPFLREQRIETGNETFAGILGRGDLGEVLLIKQGELERPALDQRADGRAPQGGNPPNPGMGAQVPELRLGEHAAIADQDEARDPKLRLQVRDLIRHRRRIAGVAGIHIDRHGSALGIRQDAVHDNWPAGMPVAVMPVARRCGLRSSCC